MGPSSEVERLHREIATAVGKLSQELGPAVRLSQVARATGHDPRTVRNHLRVMAFHRRIVFLDRAQTMFCTPQALSAIASRLEEATDDELMLAGQIHFSRINWPERPRKRAARRTR